MATQPEEPEIEIEDDTPEQDRNRAPMPQEIVDDLENDEMEEYSANVKQRMLQMKKVWHDERREKERFQRENAEAVAAAKRLHEENQRLKSTLTQGEGMLVDSFKQTASMEVEKAKRELREAHEEVDPAKIADAQEKLARATYRAQQVESYKPLQPNDKEVEVPQQAPRPDAKTVAWQERNGWYGSDPEMTATALGLHQKLLADRGPQYAGSDEYWSTIDTTMARRYPEYFGEQSSATPNVVAPASRSRSPKKIVLKQSQIAIAKKLGVTPEQYARELAKMES